MFSIAPSTHVVVTRRSCVDLRPEFLKPSPSESEPLFSLSAAKMILISIIAMTMCTEMIV